MTNVLSIAFRATMFVGSMICAATGGAFKMVSILASSEGLARESTAFDGIGHVTLGIGIVAGIFAFYGMKMAESRHTLLGISIPWWGVAIATVAVVSGTVQVWQVRDLFAMTQ